MNRIRRVMLGMGLAGCMGASSGWAADWPAWRGAKGDGVVSEPLPDTLPVEGLKRAWKVQVGVGFTAATVSGGRVYTMGNVDKTDQATVWCLDAATGGVKWKREWDSKLEPTMYEGGPNATPVVEGGALYVVVKPARVLRLKADTGETVWETDLAAKLAAELSPWGISGAPRIEGDAVVVNYGSNGTLLDAATGAVRWTTGRKSPSFNVPTPARVGNEPALMVLATNALVGVRMKDGGELFRHPFGEGYFCHASDPVVNGSSVFISSADHGGQLIDFSSGQPRVEWKTREFGNFMVTPVVMDGHLYGINACDVKQTETTLRCVEWKTGKVKWSQPGFGWGSFVAGPGNRMLLLSDKGELTLASVTPDGFRNLGSFQALGGKCWTPPVVANGRVYVRNAAGELVCYLLPPTTS
jgi:outer membrane protein assembly factor BamB